MNLTLFFRLIVMSIFQRRVTIGKEDSLGREMSYEGQLFYCPVVYAKDGFRVSLQINAVNYCSSENGYRRLGHTFETVEFGFPSEDEKLLHKYTESYGYGGWDDDNNEIPFNEESFTSVNKVGNIPVTVLEEIFAKHGGIDWEKTISVEQFNNIVKS